VAYFWGGDPVVGTSECGTHVCVTGESDDIEERGDNAAQLLSLATRRQHRRRRWRPTSRHGYLTH